MTHGGSGNPEPPATPRLLEVALVTRCAAYGHDGVAVDDGAGGVQRPLPGSCRAATWCHRSRRLCSKMYRAAWSPIRAPATLAERKWMPSHTRASITSSIACWKFV
jgi:hypothetical protein